MVELAKWAMISLAIPAAAGIHADYEHSIDEKHAELVRTSEAEAAAFKRDGDYLLLLIPRLSSKDPAEAEVARFVLFSLADQDQSTPSLKAAAIALRNTSAAFRAGGNPDQRMQSAQISGADAAAQNAKPSAPPSEKVEGVSAPPATVVAPVLPARAYIQYYADAQLADVERLRAELIKRGVAVPEVENVVASHPGQPQVIKYAQRGATGVRYFHNADQSAAVALAAAVREILGPDAAVQIQDRSRASTGVKPGQVEVWLPCQPAGEDGATCG